jgi:hypothetical protein
VAVKAVALIPTGVTVVRAVEQESKPQLEHQQADHLAQRQHQPKVSMAETVSEVPRSNIATVVVAVGHQSKETMAWSMSVSLLKLSQVRAVREQLQASRAVRSLELGAVVAQRTVAVRHRARQGSGERAAAEMARLGHPVQTAQSTPVQAVARRDIHPHSELVETVAQDLWCCDTQTCTTN